MYDPCANHFKQKRKAIPELFEQKLMTGFKPIKNKGLE